MQPLSLVTDEMKDVYQVGNEDVRMLVTLI